MKLAIIHDWLLQMGGAERVLIEFHSMFPEAPIYTLFADSGFVKAYLPKANIQTSFLQKIPFVTKIYPKLLPLIPSAIESFDLSEFDTVISSSTAYSKGLVLKPKTKHLCYCYGPTRLLWDRAHEYTRGKERSFSTKLAQHLLRIWDRQAAERVDTFIAISEAVKDRIRKYYHRDSKIIYPPLSYQAGFKSEAVPPKEYYLIVSRLYPSKNLEIAIRAFNKTRHKLVICGQGPMKQDLQRMAEKNISFTGFVSDAKLAEYYKHCRAFIMPQEEDFGLTSLEAMSFGRPVLALRKGGACETILEGITGEFFNDPIPEALADGLIRLNEHYPKYSPETIKKRASEFSVERFRKEWKELLSL